uniref:Phospholipid phosphatase 6-like n=1 Tax=Hirondellea gigas TaxID=1518452 RepID=A0A2P2I0K9_9CRUS
MGGKRVVTPLLRRILDWDVKTTNNVLAAIIKKTGPMRKYSTTLSAVEMSGNGIVWLASCVVIVFMSSDLYTRHLVVNLLIALIADLIVVAVVKATTRRRRPAPLTGDPFAIQKIDQFSFPSGHATRATMVCTLFAIQYDLSMLLEVPLYTWFMSVVASRLLLRRHYILDIVSGIMIGWLTALMLVITGAWISVDSANYLVAYLLDETYTGASYDV